MYSLTNNEINEEVRNKKIIEKSPNTWKLNSRILIMGQRKSLK